MQWLSDDEFPNTLGRRQTGTMDLLTQEMGHTVLDSFKAKIQQKSKVIGIINGSERQAHYTVVTLSEVLVGDEIEINGTWHKVISVESQTSTWDDITTWRLYV